MFRRIPKNRKRIGVLFGGRSVEHEISIITALQLIEALDSLTYEIVPIYLHPSGRWFTGENLLDRSFYRAMPKSLSLVEEVTLLPNPIGGGLRKIRASEIEEGELILGEQIPVDVFIPAFHGQFGEDGCIQGLLEMADQAYTGCSVAPSAVAMNKYICKMYLKAHGVPVLPSALAHKSDALKDFKEVRESVLNADGLKGFPLFVKPCNLGSSVGVSKAIDIPSLDAAIAKVFIYDTAAIIEPCVKNLMEINVSVVDGPTPKVSVIEVPVSDSGVLSYEEKYLRGGGKKGGNTQSQGMASLTRIIDPEELDPKIKRDVQDYALYSFKLLGCSGVGRFDFMMDLDAGKIYFNELNPLPGSLAFYLWEKTKPPLLYTEILNRIIERAEHTKALKDSLNRDFGFKALK